MRGLVLALVLLLCGALPGIAQGVTAPPEVVPILTIDQDRLFEGSAFGKRIQDEIEEALLELAAENRQIEADLIARERALTEERPNLTPEDFRARADAFDTSVQGIRETQDAKSRTLVRQRDDARAAFFAQIGPVLAEIVRERGALVVIERRNLFISADRIDVTDLAIARIDAEIGTGAP